MALEVHHDLHQPTLPAGVPSAGVRPGSVPVDSSGWTQGAGTSESTPASLSVLWEQTEDQRNRGACPRSNSRAEINTPGQGSLFGVPAIGSKGAGPRSVRRNCGQLHTQTPGRKQEADQERSHWDTSKDQTLKEACMWDAMLSVPPEQPSNAKQVATLKVGRTGPQEGDDRFPGTWGASQGRLPVRSQLLTEIVSYVQCSL